MCIFNLRSAVSRGQTGQEYLLLINSILFVLFVRVWLLAVVLARAWTTDPVSTSFSFLYLTLVLSSALKGASTQEKDR